MRPFLKWAGNKYRLISKITDMLPAGNRLLEPFAGSAAVFLNTGYAANVVNDCNADLINVYVTLKERGPVFIDACKQLFQSDNNMPEAYYRFREEFNMSTDPFRKATLFLYLNRHGYNGLCRYNQDGGFNVPFGRYRKPYFPHGEMRFFFDKAQATDFSCVDFESVMEEAVLGDVVYCDPPYVPLSETANFTGYQAGGFDAKEHLRLARAAERLAARGIPVLISNHYNDFTVETYAQAERITFDVQRFISCDGANRNKATEVLALFRAK